MVVGVKVSGVVSFPSYGRCSGAAGLGCEGGRRAGAGPLYVLRFSARRSARAVCPGALPAPCSLSVLPGVRSQRVAGVLEGRSEPEGGYH